MGGGRKLPPPIDGTQEYLAAILDELRAQTVLLTALSATAQPPACSPVLASEPAPESIVEPAPASLPDPGPEVVTEPERSIPQETAHKASAKRSTKRKGK